ncbi:hypothetical protein CRE_14024 [Caenorhabditis remanei]|uniref:F-box associated domain-containing protein n=1 Tax=Caenorhabditis remanei TaxID=31234 RepID=E3M8V3_CAERE|nr:hypothetical protein CRE_14024 [Caenorhabditis remanei]
MVHVWYKERWETSDFSRFSPKPWDPKQRDQIHREKNGSQMDFADGLDILRADGMLATIMDSPRDFHFKVWKQRFTVWNEREDWNE